MHFPDRDGKVHANSEGCGAREESSQYEQAPQEFREGRNIAEPGGQPQTRNEMGVLMQAAENLVVTVHEHNGTQGKPHEQKRKWLQPFKVAQESSAVNVQITAEKPCRVKSGQQNNCVAAQLLVTFFRPPSESCMLGESTTRSPAGPAEISCSGAGMSAFWRGRSPQPLVSDPLFACGSDFGFPRFLCD